MDTKWYKYTLVISLLTALRHQTVFAGTSTLILEVLGFRILFTSWCLLRNEILTRKGLTLSNLTQNKRLCVKQPVFFDLQSVSLQVLYVV